MHRRYQAGFAAPARRQSACGPDRTGGGSRADVFDVNGEDERGTTAGSWDVIVGFSRAEGDPTIDADAQAGFAEQVIGVKGDGGGLRAVKSQALEFRIEGMRTAPRCFRAVASLSFHNALIVECTMPVSAPPVEEKA